MTIISTIVQGDVAYRIEKQHVTSMYADFELTAFSEKWDYIDVAFEYRRDRRYGWNADAVITSTTSQYLRGNKLYGLAASLEGTVNTIRWEYPDSDLFYGDNPDVRIRLLPRIRAFGSANSNYSAISMYGDSLIDVHGFSSHQCVGVNNDGQYICLDSTSIYILDNLEDENTIYQYSVSSPNHAMQINNENYIVNDGNSIIELDSTLSSLTGKSVVVSAPTYFDYAVGKEIILVTSASNDVVTEYSWSDLDFGTLLWTSTVSLDDPQCSTYRQGNVDEIVIADTGNIRVVTIDRLTSTTKSITNYKLSADDTETVHDISSFVAPYRVFGYRDGNICVIERRGRQIDIAAIGSSSSSSSIDSSSSSSSSLSSSSSISSNSSASSGSSSSSSSESSSSSLDSSSSSSLLHSSSSSSSVSSESSSSSSVSSDSSSSSSVSSESSSSSSSVSSDSSSSSSVSSESSSSSSLDSSSSSSSAFMLNEKSLLFDGIDDYAESDSNINITGTSARTLSGWLKTTNIAKYQHGINYGTTAGSGYAFGVITYLSEWLLYGPGTPGTYAIETGVTPDTDWHHHAITLSGTSGYYYLDGVLIAFDTSLTMNTQAAKMVIGRRVVAGSANWEGNIDEVSMWDDILSGPEISEIYNNGCPGELSEHSKESNLVNWWRMGDGDTYPTILDHKGGNNLTMINMGTVDIVDDVICDTVSSSSSS